MVSVSNPYDVFRSAKELNAKYNFLYGLVATKSLIDKFEMNFELIDKMNTQYKLGIDYEKVRKATTTFEYD
jgi:predicted alpha/beta-fold hydrolase